MYDKVPSKRRYGKYQRYGWYTEMFIAFMVFVGVLLFGLFLLGIYVSKDGLDATSKATVAMHDETVKMKKDVSVAMLNFRSKFLPNQEEITTRQILKTIENVESITASFDRILSETSNESIDSYINMFVANLTKILTELFGQEAVENIITNITQSVNKVTNILDLLKEDHVTTLIENTTYLTGNATIVISKVDPDDAAQLIKNLSTITSDINGDHIVERVNNITITLNEILNHLKELHTLQINI